MPADRGLVGRILLRRRAPAPLIEALTTRTQSADSVTIVTPMKIDSRCPNSRCPKRVKTGKAHREHMFSALPPRTDIERPVRHVRFVP